MSLGFRNEDDLLHWLQTTNQGRGLLREALFSAQAGSDARTVVSDIVKSERSHRVLIKAFSDGWLEVYGERHTQVYIIELPDSTQQLGKVEQYTESKLPWLYRELHAPGYLRETAKIKVGVGYHQFTRQRSETALDLALIEGCNRVPSVRPVRGSGAGD